MNLLKHWTTLLFVILFISNNIYGQTPNFVVILVDDQGWTGTSVEMINGDATSKSDYYQTPNLETMATNGMVFSQAYASAPKCSPSRASILTGRTPARNGFTTTSTAKATSEILEEASTVITLNSSYTTVGEWLKATSLDYRTAHYGKWHIGNGGPADHGFDYGSSATTNDDGDNGNGLVAQTDPKKMYDLTDSATTFIQNSHDDGKPFYLQVSHYAVHTAVEAKQTTIDTYNDAVQRPLGTNHDDPEYGAMTEDLDGTVGTVIAKLTALGILNNTYIIYTSDNGAATGKSTNKPLLRGKTFIYEGGIRVPFIIQGPGITGGTYSTEPIVGYDLFPTIAELSTSANALPTDIDGQSIKSIWDGGTFTRTNPLYFHSPHYESNAAKSPRSAIIEGDNKLIVEYETGINYLFNLSTDIGENTNIASSNASTVTSMLIKLRDYLESVNAEMPSLDAAHSNFSGTAPDIDGDGMDDSWEFTRSLSYMHNSVMNNAADDYDSDGATHLEEHDYNSDPLTDEGLSASAASFSDTGIVVLETIGTTTLTIAFPFYNSTGGDLAVAYTLTGTATSATDFTALSGTVTIPNGSNKADITVTITDDSDEENTETIILTLDIGGSSVGVTSGTTTSYRINISDNDCSTEAALDLSLRSCNDDPAGDGLTDLYTETEYAGADVRQMQTNGVPNHFYRAPSTLAESPETYLIDLTPTAAGSTTDLVSTSGVQYQFGLALNGVRINPIAAEPWVNPSTSEENWEWVLDFTSSPGDLSADCNYAHLNSAGKYHYHGDMVKYADLLSTNMGTGTVPVAPVQLGWAADGYPIYYKYGYTDAANSSSMIELTSNYALKAGNRAGDGVSAPCGPHTGKYIADYEYNAGNGGHLDECNGRTGVTPEFPGGTYYYVITSAFPMVPRCFTGSPSSDFGTGSNGEVLALPVELVAFTGALKYDEVQLNWTTAAEINNQGFELYRTNDGGNWELLDFISGMGTTVETTSYTYVDENPMMGENYYKLKQIDFDGQSDYSQTIVVTIQGTGSAFNVFPNPVKDWLYYDVIVAEEIETLIIYDMLGKVVKTTSIVDGSLSMTDLSAGVYYLVGQSAGGDVFKQKIIKQ